MSIPVTLRITGICGGPEDNLRRFDHATVGGVDSVEMTLIHVNDNADTDAVRELLALRLLDHSHIHAHGSDWMASAVQWDGGPSPVVTYRRVS